MTEAPLPVRFDLKTLETLGVFDYKAKLPKNMCFESAIRMLITQEKRASTILLNTDAKVIMSHTELKRAQRPEKSWGKLKSKDRLICTALRSHIIM